MNGPLRFLLFAVLVLLAAVGACWASSASSDDVSTAKKAASALPKKTSQVVVVNPAITVAANVPRNPSLYPATPQAAGAGPVIAVATRDAENPPIQTAAYSPTDSLIASLPVTTVASDPDPTVPGAMAAASSGGNAANTDNPAYNPDPGASQRPAQSPFYQAPAGTPPDYGGEREPLLDQPHAPLLDIPIVHKDWQNRDFLSTSYPPGTQGGLNRWYLPIPVWQRYNNTDVESPYMYQTPQLWDPYKQSILKGDTPIIGQDIFFAMTATSFTSYEARDVPTPSGVSSASANSSEFYGQGDQMEVDQFFSLSLDLFQGETVFQPVTWDLHVQPVYNINWTRVEETGILSVDPRGSNSQSDNNGLGTNNSGNGNNGNSGFGAPGGGLPGFPGGGLPGNPGTGFQKIGPEQFGNTYLTRTKDFISLQEAYLELHIADFSDNYDFLSIRIGNQPFNADFRGFVFNDTNLGVRLFGNMDSNRWQFNLAAFDMREKDTYSELNTFDSRNQYVFVANVYRQDFLVKGLTEQVDFLADLDDADTHYDRTGNLVDPEPLGGPIEPHDIRAYYVGWNGDGHIGRFNITHSLYEVMGRDTLNGLAGQPVDINAQMGALELSYDVDWVRFKASFFYGSGDDNPQDGHATGFDTILDNPNFAGGPFSYYSRQGFVFGDTSVNFKQRDSLLLDLRSSKDEGQPNFVNPGVFIYGVGSEISLMPTMKLFLNANYIEMADTQTVNFALHTTNVTPQIGWDLSGGIQYRPLLTNNIIISAGLGALLPGDGYKAIYQTNTATVPGYTTAPPGHVDSFLYSGFAAVTLTY
jgi:hypothetical protein